MPQTAEYRNCVEAIPGAVRAAGETLKFIGREGVTSPGEIADCAYDLIDEAVYLDTRTELPDLYVEITRAVYSALSLSSAASDATDVPGSDLWTIAEGKPVTHSWNVRL